RICESSILDCSKRKREAMRIEKDYKVFIALLNEHSVLSLVVGAYAVSYYARPRNTGDIDFFVNNSKENIKRLLTVLAEFGFVELDLSQKEFGGEDKILKLGYEPIRMDILIGISGIAFKEFYVNRKCNKL